MDKNMNMKFIGIFVVLVLIIGFGLVLIDNQGENSTANMSGSLSQVRLDNSEAVEFEGESLAISIEESEIKWEGRKTLVPNYADSGTLSFQSGEFFINDGVVVGGRAIFDMNSIEVLSTGILRNEDVLKNHLKSDDFFSVENYPTAELVIKEITPVAGQSEQFTLSGVLTMKGITQNVSFPARVSYENGRVEIQGKTDLDRTLWDIRFGSNKFFDNLANNVIDDFFSVEFKVVAES